MTDSSQKRSEDPQLPSSHPVSTHAHARTCADLLAFVDSSPTPFHAVHSAAARLSAAGFTVLPMADSWAQLQPGRYLVPVGDGTLVAFVLPSPQRSEASRPRTRGFRIIGAHTDSPNLRLKPKPVYEKHGYLQLGVEVYGGALLNSWLDRDLQLAGRVVFRDADGRLMRRLVRLPQPLVRVAQLAIHLDREVNEKGLLLNRQEHLAPLLGLCSSRPPRTGSKTSGDAALIHELCAQALDLSLESIVSTELMLHDSLPATRGGLAGELIFAPRLDNLAMSHAAVCALQRQCERPTAHENEAGLVPMIALFDHEEIGSSSAYGAQAPILPAILERIILGTGGDREHYHQALAGSLCLSADMSHAVHPNYADRHEANHRPVLNGGPVIKVNSQQRYATCSRTAALFQELCRRAQVPFQYYSHRTDLPCGSTIGPITATLLGIPTVDVGSPMLSMHSARELGGSDDPEHMTQVMSLFLDYPDSV